MSKSAWPVYAGIVWSVLFALMSFYWAAGGMLGVLSLGGQIYERALTREPDFLALVWITGLIKVGGALLLAAMLRRRPYERKWIGQGLYYAGFIGGLLIALYGLLNFSTILMSILGILELSIDSYAKYWRLLFWEPFWIVGGVLYVMASKRYRNNRLRNPRSPEQRPHAKA
ncbi:hypothetical protein J31TS4_19850 [Paenibacillus sp. J31TS4]|uniref:DUF3995 domain-containing protein n=1 Tax=Paenibacillus sp. J31TS4 TaxID=2807195 RepID=UPI001B2183D0|nr:DUF3995 domain-containing protein [Paenibacillus sp. J31TS4]GIP38705.1 hypothetical protein J31TS4_19850 [Paenibacillus sp. J31TS4]